ncbi:conserved exported hypothetical protein [Vibrio aestuarianus]|uniref:hypothetical protein n=1 Tax=Vibrio aestuarianus TaxID=28171 RepID=UPI001455E172|nr:hypothetical protein [Vibrio aestuarianus]NLS56573.1 hypothetical protein [Vibrio aestuarianus subsp. francensis]CAH8232166.1 conserved exported hypothetical protein [Vibrio aestuarianus]
MIRKTVTTVLLTSIFSFNAFAASEELTCEKYNHELSKYGTSELVGKTLKSVDENAKVKRIKFSNYYHFMFEADGEQKTSSSFQNRDNGFEFISKKSAKLKGKKFVFTELANDEYELTVFKFSGRKTNADTGKKEYVYERQIMLSEKGSIVYEVDNKEKEFKYFNVDSNCL